jgi:flavin-dependent dehydrogenase
MRIEDYDAVIVGGSFAGLAAASQLQGAGRVLLVDREPLGAGETSACGTLLAVLERLDALDALEQILPEIAVNVGGRRIAFLPGYPFATFDYRTLCGILVSRLDGVEVAVAGFGGVDSDGALIIGEDRRVRGRVLVDASGWRALLAREYGAPPSDPAHRSIGIELRHGHGGCDLEFWVRPDEVPDGVFWAFPAGTHTREGVASYTGSGARLRSTLARFVAEERLPSRAVHGGVFPSRLRDPVAGPVFVVGDAAGQCLPLTGEGIRPALVWGQEAGRQAARALRGEISLDAALAAYRSRVLAHRWQYRILEGLQAAMLWTSPKLLPLVVPLFTDGPFARAAQRSYWYVADPNTLEVAPGVRSTTRATVTKCAVGPVGGAVSGLVVEAPFSHASTCGCARRTEELLPQGTEVVDGQGSTLVVEPETRLIPEPVGEGIVHEPARGCLCGQGSCD